MQYNTNNKLQFIWWKTTFDRRPPLMKDNLWQKTTFDGRRHNGRRPLTEDHLWQKLSFDRSWPLTEDALWRKMTFDGRRSLTEDDLWRKTQLRRRSDYCHPVAFFFLSLDYGKLLTSSSGLAPNSTNLKLWAWLCSPPSGLQIMT